MIMSDEVLSVSEDLAIIAANKGTDHSKGNYMLTQREDIIKLCVGTCKDFVSGILGDVRVHIFEIFQATTLANRTCF